MRLLSAYLPIPPLFTKIERAKVGVEKFSLPPNPGIHVATMTPDGFQEQQLNNHLQSLLVPMRSKHKKCDRPVEMGLKNSKIIKTLHGKKDRRNFADFLNHYNNVNLDASDAWKFSCPDPEVY